MNKTKIEWVKNPDGTQGYTWNPITGCLNGCPYCYARKLANGRLKQRYLANHNFPNYLQVGFPHTENALLDPFYPRFWEDRLIDPCSKAVRRGTRTTMLYGQSPKGIFVCDMSDLFGIGIPEDWTRRVMNIIEDCPQHRFYLLTKQPQNLIKFSPFPENCWVGVTATNREQYLTATSDKGLDGITAKIKYISFEPLLEQIGASEYRLNAVNWVIIGAQTKPYKPPEISWVEEIVKAADVARIPVFCKDNLLELLPIKPPFFIDPGPGKTAHYRQEMP